MPDTPELQKRGRQLHPHDTETPSSSTPACTKIMSDEDWIDDVVKSFKSMGITSQSQFMKKLNDALEPDTIQTLLDGLYYDLHLKKGLGTYPENFVTLSLNAMERLEKAGKPNLIYHFTRCIAEDRPGTKTPLLPFDHMPFGLIEHQIQFFSHTNQAQIKIPHDYRQWQVMMEIEFGLRFNRLFRGPGWSGNNEERGYPYEVL
ncbi:uncharacterized protein [Amphiura filiformis]|uniref:uncharacterized protein n=1 Tax=Amphiura filiformis TaxID=82378 RepID=UPI003B218BE2